MRSATPSILWLRQDLRLEDNPALREASQKPFFALYIRDINDPHQPMGASLWWLHHSLNALRASFKKRGIPLIFRQGDPLHVLQDLIQETGASSIYWNRCYEPYAIERDKKIKAFLKDQGITCQSFNSSLLSEPWEIGKSYKVFTPFWKTLQTLSIPVPLPIPQMKGWRGKLITDDLSDWHLLPQNWGEGFKTLWKPGEKGAHQKLAKFLEEKLSTYSQLRDYPYNEGTSRLSPHLHWGELSVRKIWHLVMKTQGPIGLPFLRELGWREFSNHLLYQFPHLPEKPLKTIFNNFTWDQNPEGLKAWQKGLTGYPLVDAGMRELWHTGWMHNRIRMVVASFLVKDLLLPWQTGEAWFWETLLDADLANNSVNWQWVAGCGADAAPFFRIFNPIIQSEKFDPKGEYIKKWVPELARLDPPYLHTPWLAQPYILDNAGIELGKTYPYPVVDHKNARQRALSKFRSLK